MGVLNWIGDEIGKLAGPSRYDQGGPMPSELGGTNTDWTADAGNNPLATLMTNTGPHRISTKRRLKMMIPGTSLALTGTTDSTGNDTSDDPGYNTSDRLQVIADAIGVNSLSLRGFMQIARSIGVAPLMGSLGVDPTLVAKLLAAGSSRKRRRRGITYRQLSNCRRVIGTLRSMSAALHLGTGAHRHAPKYAFHKKRKQ